MSTINKRVLESFRKKLSKDKLIQLFNLLNQINFNRALKSNGGLAQSEILDLLKKIDLKDLNSTELKLIEELKMNLEDK